MLWLPRYFRYSIKAKPVESTGTGSDKSFTEIFTYVLSVLQSLKEWKENKTKNEKRSTVKHKEVENIEQNMFVIFGMFLNKVKKKENSWP